MNEVEGFPSSLQSSLHYVLGEWILDWNLTRRLIEGIPNKSTRNDLKALSCIFNLGLKLGRNNWPCGGGRRGWVGWTKPPTGEDRVVIYQHHHVNPALFHPRVTFLSHDATTRRHIDAYSVPTKKLVSHRFYWLITYSRKTFRL